MQLAPMPLKFHTSDLLETSLPLTRDGSGPLNRRIANEVEAEDSAKVEGSGSNMVLFQVEYCCPQSL